MKMGKLSTWLFVTLTVPVVILALWTLLAELTESLYWPSPLAIARVFPKTWLDGRMAEDVVPSLVRLAVGYVCALAIGIAIGLVVGSVRRLRLTVEPVFEFFRAIPPPVLVPIMMLIAGIGDGMKITVIAFGCMWPILLNTVEGVRGIDGIQIDTARSYSLRRTQRLLNVTIPSASPKIFVGARQSLAIGLIMMVISEMFAASNGLGYNIVQFQRLFQLKEMWSGIILLGIIGVAANAIFKLVEKRCLRWYLGMQSQER
jgi:ABC-type nitrate/sulfonate/bicarbonate transport system permease component